MSAMIFEHYQPTEPTTYAPHVNICTGELFDISELPPMMPSEDTDDFVQLAHDEPKDTEPTKTPQHVPEFLEEVRRVATDADYCRKLHEAYVKRRGAKASHILSASGWKWMGDRDEQNEYSVFGCLSLYEAQWYDGKYQISELLWDANAPSARPYYEMNEQRPHMLHKWFEKQYWDDDKYVFTLKDLRAIIKQWGGKAKGKSRDALNTKWGHWME